MISCRLFLSGEGAMNDVDPQSLLGAVPVDHSGVHGRQAMGEVCRIMVLPHGLGPNTPSVAFAMMMPNGQWALGETSVAVLLAAVRSIELAYGDHVAEGQVKVRSEVRTEEVAKEQK